MDDMFIARLNNEPAKVARVCMLPFVCECPTILLSLVYFVRHAGVVSARIFSSSVRYIHIQESVWTAKLGKVDSVAPGSNAICIRVKLCIALCGRKCDAQCQWQ
jgi:hypothetical protein